MTELFLPFTKDNQDSHVPMESVGNDDPISGSIAVHIFKDSVTGKEKAEAGILRSDWLKELEKRRRSPQFC